MDYVKFRIPLFLCKSIDNRCGVRKDKEGFIYVNFNRLGYQHDPFILAIQAKHVFYIADPIDKKWHIVLPGKRHIVGVENVVDEEEYDHFDEISPFSADIETVPLINTDEKHYLRSNHEEGVWVQRRKSKR
jgi:Domain of unknown function (DUF4216)